MPRLPVLFIACLLLALNACQAPKPQGIMSPQEFAQVLIDIHLSEARLSGYGLSPDSAAKLFSVYNNKLLQRHGMADSAIRQSYRYYLQHPTELEVVYAIVVDSLSLREQRATTTKPN